MSKSIILTGIRSNEEPTIANYLGSVLPTIKMQQNFAGKYQINMFVPDLHSFTTPIDFDHLYFNTLQNLRYFIAAGLTLDDPDTYLYRQSYIPAHSELTWILSCFTSFGEMSRMTQFKEKTINSQTDFTSVGLFSYPILMASDILLYGAKYVPVGEDQFQHIEITRDIATRFNNRFGDIFVVPESTKVQTEFMKRDSGLRIRSLTNPYKKMSKSDPDDKSKILLKDDPALASKKIMVATTDSVGVINFDWENQPGITSLLQIEAILTGQTQDQVNRQWVGQTSYGEFKKAVAKTVADFLDDFQTRLKNIPDQILLNKLQSSEQELNLIANQTLLRVQKAVGLRQK